MTNISKTFALVIIVVLCLHCSGSGGETPQVETEAVTRFMVVDHGNQGNALDLFVSFTIPASESDIASYDLFLVPNGSNSIINEAFVKQLPASNKLSISKTGDDIFSQVNSSFMDTDGNAIVVDQSYTAYIYSRPEMDEATGRISNLASISLLDEPYFEVQTFATFPGMEAINYYEEGNYFIGPGPNNSLYKVELSDGSHSVFATGLSTPYGGGFDPADGTFYISNFDINEVLSFDAQGNRELVATGLNGPTGIDVDKEGNLFVNNYWSSTITKIDTEGRKSTFARNASGLIQGPDGLVFANDELYCINFDNPRILKISDTGSASLLATLPGRETGYIAYGNNPFYAASLSERKIYQVDQNGTFRAIAGSGADEVKDGPAVLAGFTGPNGIAYVDGIVYVSDRQSIRMIIRYD